MNRNMKKIVIVGGGPAGMMAAIIASQLTNNVTLIEKNDILGKKLLLTGNGRCNFTNSNGLELFLKGYGKNGKFLKDAFKLFFNKELIEFFESRGLKTITENDKRVFPHTNKALSVCKILEKELVKNNVKIFLNKQLKDILVENNKIKAIVLYDHSKINVDSLILATGGLSYSSTGSNGEGIKIVEKLGHDIVSLRPGLVPLVTDKKSPSSLDGLSLKDVCVNFETKDKKIKTSIGDLIFTKNGISGPIILSISGQIIDLMNNNIKISTSIDLVPYQNKKETERDISNYIQNNPKKSISNALKIKFPDRLIDYSMNVLEIDPFHKANQLKVRQRNKIVSFLKSMKLDILGFESYEKAMITRGGISLKDIDPRIMSSKKIKGLFFAGEMIDINGDSGGYNLQAAFSTGFLAGNSAVRYKKNNNSLK